MRPDREHARPGEVGPAEPAARPPGPRREGEEDAAGEHRLHHQELAHPEGEGLEPVAHGVGAQPREPERAAGEAQHQADRRRRPPRPRAEPASASASRCWSTDAAA